jgi:perosamine synthetase
MEEITKIAKENGLYIIEDAAEAHGAEYNGVKAGSFSEVSAFSFYSNKNVATGEGGMVLTNDPELERKCRYFKNLCFPLDNSRTYQHDDIGFNYRMTNVHAAIGLAQTEKADYYRNLRIENNMRYRNNLLSIPGIEFQKIPSNTLSVHWMNAIIIDPEYFGTDRDGVVAHLKLKKIETRLLFTGMHKQPALQKYGCNCSGSYPVTDKLGKNGFYLPSGSNLSTAKIDKICQEVLFCHK